MLKRFSRRHVTRKILEHTKFSRASLILFMLLAGAVGSYFIVAGHAASVIPAGGVNSEPSMRPWRYIGANPDSWWDACDNNWQTRVPQEVTYAQQAHVTYVRIEFPWALIETQKGVYDWSRADYIVNQVAAAGLQLEPVVVYTPSWSSGYPADPPGSSSDYANFMTALVNRYKSSVHYWEMWNEPNLGSYWNGTTQQYVQDILTPGYQAVKAADPSAKVVIGPAGGFDSTFISDVYAAGGGGSFDIVAFHEYDGATNAIADANSWRSFLDGKGQTNIPVWVGEFGYSNSDPSDPTQSQWIQTVFQTSSPLTTAIWYAIRDDSVYTGCGSSNIIKSEYYGLIQSDDTTIKQGYYTLQSILASSGAPSSPTATITAQPAIITSGSSATLSWSSTNATSCSASGGWSGTRSTNGSSSVSPTSTITYTITCTGSGGSASDAATVTVSASVLGDCNGDSHVNVFDLSLLLSHYGATYAQCDFNSDNIVNILDLSVLLSHYGT